MSDPVFQEWYKRSRAVMGPMVRTYGTFDTFRFDFWTNELELVELIRLQPYTVSTGYYGIGGNADERDWDLWVSFIVQGLDSWQNVTALLDSEILRDIWGQAIYDALEIEDAQQ
jgi:hypothetical protein